VDFIGDPQFWTNLVRIIWIDLLLAGDNAVVIALAVRSLPKRQQWWGRIWGTVGAVGLRLDLRELDGRLDDAFAASVFATEDRADVRASLQRDLVRLRALRSLKFFHSWTGARRLGAKEVC